MDEASKSYKDPNTKTFGKNESVPDSFWVDLATSYENISLKILRRNGLGHLQTSHPNVMFETVKMPNLDQWIKAYTGGSGAHPYEIHVRAPDEPTKLLAQFYLSIEGPVRPPISPIDPKDVERDEEPIFTMPDGMTFSQPIDGYDQPAFLPHELAELEALAEQSRLPFDFYDSAALPSYPPEEPMTHDPQRPVQMPPHAPEAQPARGGERWQSTQDPRPYDPRLRPAPGVATMHTDRILLAEKERANLEAAKERSAREVAEQRLDDERRARLESERAMNERLANMEAERREERHRAELAAVMSKVEALANRPTVVEAPKAPSQGEQTVAMIAALAPLVPLFIAMVESGKAEKTAMIAAQTTSQATMMQTFAAAANKPVNDPLELVKVLAPLLLPLLKPDKPDMGGMAQILEATANSQMQSHAMYTQLLGSIAEGGNPEQAKSFLQEILPVLPGIGDAVWKIVREMQGMGAPQQPPRQISAGAPAQRAAQPQVVVSRPPAAPAATTAPAQSSLYSTVDETAGAPAVPTVPTAPSAEAVAADAALANAQPETVSTPHLEAVEGGASGMPDESFADGSVMTSEPMEVPRGIFDMLPEAMRTSGWKGWIRSVFAGDPSNELGEELAELLASLDHSKLPPEYSRRINEDTVEAMRTIAGMLPPTVANPAYGESIIGFSIERLNEIIAEARAEADEEEDDEDDEENEERDEEEEEAIANAS